MRAYEFESQVHRKTKIFLKSMFFLSYQLPLIKIWNPACISKDFGKNKIVPSHWRPHAKKFDVISVWCQATCLWWWNSPAGYSWLRKGPKLQRPTSMSRFFHFRSRVFRIKSRFEDSLSCPVCDAIINESYTANILVCFLDHEFVQFLESVWDYICHKNWGTEWIPLRHGPWSRVLKYCPLVVLALAIRASAYFLSWRMFATFFVQLNCWWMNFVWLYLKALAACRCCYSQAKMWIFLLDLWWSRTWKACPVVNFPGAQISGRQGFKTRPFCHGIVDMDFHIDEPKNTTKSVWRPGHRGTDATAMS